MKNKRLNRKQVRPAGHKYQKSKGVTLVELVVVLAVFTVILVTSVSIFISMVQNQKGILQEQELLSQTSYVEEYMARTIRSGVKDLAGNCIGAGNLYQLTHYDATVGMYNGIKFVTSDGVCQEFFLDVDKVVKEIKDTGTSQNLLSSKFQVKYLRFIINGNKGVSTANQKDSLQPRITLVLDIKVQTPVAQQEKIIQTTVSQVNLNVN